MQFNSASQKAIWHRPLGASCICLNVVSAVTRTKIGEFTLDALRTRQSLVKGERLVRHEVRAVLPNWVDNLIDVCSRITLAGLLLSVSQR